MPVSLVPRGGGVSLHPQVEMILRNSIGATIHVRRGAAEEPGRGLVLRADRGIEAIVFDVPADWPERILTLLCEMYCDSAVLQFTARARRPNRSRLQLAMPRDVRVTRQRAHVRIPVDLDVVIEPETTYGSGHRAVDISGGGLALQTRVPLQLGEQLTISFPAEKWHSLGAVQADVVHKIADDVYGLHFPALSKEQRDRLYAIVAELLREHRSARRGAVRQWIQ